MKKTKLLYLIMIAAAIACNRSNDSNKHAVKDLRTYVDSVDKTNPNYEDEAYWTNVEQKYEEKRQQVDANASQLSEEERKDYEKVKSDYDQLKQKYVSEREKHQAEMAKANAWTERKMFLRKSLFGEGVIGEDMNFSFMTAANALSVYENFVNAVDANAKEYSREDWDEIKVLYEAMDTRKNEIEKELKGKDNTKIAGLKMKFDRIRNTQRAGSKVEENTDAKEKEEAK
jgi:hypothetical protein